MLGKLFGGSGQTVYFAFIKAFGNAFCRNYLRSAAGKSAGFINGNYLDIGQPFQRVALANAFANDTMDSYEYTDAELEALLYTDLDELGKG